MPRAHARDRRRRLGARSRAAAAAGVGTLMRPGCGGSHQPQARFSMRQRTSERRRPCGEGSAAAVNPDVLKPSRENRAAELTRSRAGVVLGAATISDAARLNRACVAANTPLVSGAAIRFDGQVAVFDPRTSASPCYHCLFGEGEELEATRCAVMGVFAPVVGIVGATQAAEALKLIAGVGEPLVGRLLLLDAFAMRWREVRVPRDPQCPVCAGR